VCGLEPCAGRDYPGRESRGREHEQERQRERCDRGSSGRMSSSTDTRVLHGSRVGGSPWSCATRRATHALQQLRKPGCCRSGGARRVVPAMESRSMKSRGSDQAVEGACGAPQPAKEQGLDVYADDHSCAVRRPRVGEVQRGMRPSIVIQTFSVSFGCCARRCRPEDWRSRDRRDKAAD